MKQKTVLEALKKISINEAVNVEWPSWSLDAHTTFTSAPDCKNGGIHNQVAVGKEQAEFMLNNANFPFYMFETEAEKNNYILKAVELSRAKTVQSGASSSVTLGFRGMRYDDAVCDYIIKKSDLLTPEKVEKVLGEDLAKKFFLKWGKEFFDILVLDTTSSDRPIVKTLYAGTRNKINELKDVYRQTQKDISGDSLTAAETSEMILILFSQTDIKPILAPITNITYLTKTRGVDAEGNALIDLPIKLRGKIYINNKAIDVIPGAQENTAGNTIRNRTQATNQLLSNAKENFKNEAVRIFLEELNRSRGNKNVTKINANAKEKVASIAHWVTNCWDAHHAIDDDSADIIAYYKSLQALEIKNQVDRYLLTGEYNIIRKLQDGLPRSRDPIWAPPKYSGLDNIK